MRYVGKCRGQVPEDCYRRSSSVDLDKQVKDIFERDEFRRRVVLEEIVSMQDKREDTASKGVFGDRVIE
ncbi:jg20792 [Pararge aegeria aegeria]|uniref:Jg20792 protein n=1 Tax=Pararge aegeria aegeria TaxID=348720 RepID=A0A8S4R9W4_9NEOP|nr:jg20792 [Pararge aegeria aegeria]